MIAYGFKYPKEVEDCTVLQLSWLERYTDNVEVGSSTLPGTTFKKKMNPMQEGRKALIPGECRYFPNPVPRSKLQEEMVHRKRFESVPFTLSSCKKNSDH